MEEEPGGLQSMGWQRVEHNEAQHSTAIDRIHLPQLFLYNTLN